MLGTGIQTRQEVAAARYLQLRAQAANAGNNQWQTNQIQPAPAPAPPPPEPARVPVFNTALLPAPPLPPEHIVTEQDRQTQVFYEQWLNHQNGILSQQLKFYETEVQKLRKIRKVCFCEGINSK